MDEIVDRSKKLGKAIAAHPRFKALLTARDAVRADAEATGIMKQFQEQLDKVHRLEIEQKPIEVADKQELAKCQQALVSNEKLKALQKAQVDHADLMRQMNDAIFSQLAEFEKAQAKPESE
jgi:cell fate (sporulation/competence/biofilm development) regulator YlbF (YheA/YmcA/DUF963 family)